MIIQILIYSALIWASAGLFYQFLLRNEKRFIFNRIFLLTGLIAGITLPVINQFDFLPADNSSAFLGIQSPDVIIASSVNEIKENIPDYNLIILIIYFLGMLFMLFRFIISIISIIKLYSKNAKEYFDEYTIIRVDQNPFSIFKFVFLRKEDQNEEVLIHELVHVREKHSFDIILIEILKIVFWVNPVIYLYSKYIKENHEFIADNKVIEICQRKTYSEILISQLQSGMQFQITNNFFNSLIKNRIKMMYRSKKPNHWKYLVAIAFGIVLVFFTNQMQSQDVTKPDKKSGKKETALTVADEMPRFPGCEDKMTKEEKEQCSWEKLMKYIWENLKYPKSAAEKGIEGQVVSRFTVTKKGRIENIEILKDIQYGCGAEVKRMLEEMNKMPEKWIPGKNKGKKVKVYMTLPVIFKLADEEKTEGKK